MPPKNKITREQIIQAALRLLRREGEAAVSIRAVAAEAGCSTQPVMSQFAAAEALKSALYAAADAEHTAYIMPQDPAEPRPMLGIGLRYIRFAAQEPQLFRFLFQSGRLGSGSPAALLQGAGSAPLVQLLAAQASIGEAAAKDAFAAIFCAVHGLASLLANNALQYDESECTRILTAIYEGVLRGTEGDAS